MTPADIARLRSLAEAATPGPWRWQVNKKQGAIELRGGAKPYDLNVMEFARWGMRGACPVVMTGGPEWQTKAHNFAVPVPGREHHKSWFQGVIHPDLNWIEAAHPQAVLALLNELAARDTLLAQCKATLEAMHPSAGMPDVDVAQLYNAMMEALGDD